MKLIIDIEEVKMMVEEFVKQNKDFVLKPKSGQNLYDDTGLNVTGMSFEIE